MNEVVVVAGQEVPMYVQTSPDVIPDCPTCTYQAPGEYNSSRNWQNTLAWYSHWLYNPDGAHRCD